MPSRDDERVSFDVTAALRSDVPLTLAGLASTMMEAMRHGGGARDRETGRRLTTVAQLADSFMTVSSPETTAMLHAFAALTPDVELARYIRGELADRDHALPDDITRLSELTACAAHVRQYADGIGESLVLELTGPGVTGACVVAYVDYRYGFAVKLAAVIPLPFDELVRVLEDAPVELDEDTTFEPIGLADAAARLRHAIAQYDVLADVIQPADYWPWHRPLIEHVMRSLPDGGVGYPLAASGGASDSVTRIRGRRGGRGVGAPHTTDATAARR